MSDETCSGCSRRQFLGRALRGVAGCALAGGLPAAAGCASVSHVDGAWLGRARLAVEPEAFGDEQDGLLVHHARLKHPVYLHRHRRPDGSWRYTAVSTTCTHRGCRAEPTGGRIICPCHGSQFDADGALLDGPADEPLARFPVEPTDERLVIRFESQEE